MKKMTALLLGGAMLAAGLRISMLFVLLGRAMDNKPKSTKEAT